VKGRNSISWEEKFTLDVWYVDHKSFLLDLKILCLTLLCVFTGKGVTPEVGPIMPRFTGAKK
jgi:sugar transferase EpsL